MTSTYVILSCSLAFYMKATWKLFVAVAHTLVCRGRAEKVRIMRTRRIKISGVLRFSFVKRPPRLGRIFAQC